MLLESRLQDVAQNEGAGSPEGLQSTTERCTQEDIDVNNREMYTLRHRGQQQRDVNSKTQSQQHDMYTH